MRRIPKCNSEHSLYEQIARYLQLQYPDVIYRFDIAADLKLTPGQAAKTRDYIRKGAIQIYSLHAMARLFSDLAMTED